MSHFKIMHGKPDVMLLHISQFCTETQSHIARTLFHINSA
jgi:hypothetical protein